MLSTFRILAELPPDSLGAYVISMAHTASDVLAVVLLQVSKTNLQSRLFLAAFTQSNGSERGSMHP